MRPRLPQLTALTIPWVVTVIGLLLVVGTLSAVGGREPSAQAVSATDECLDFVPPDRDGDGFGNCDELAYGSDPDNPASTPEDYRIDQRRGMTACSDHVDNDRDGYRDRKDDGCRSIPSIPPDCIDFDAATDCTDADRDGFYNQLETQIGSDPQDALSTPEYGLLDEQSGSSTCNDGADNDRDGKRDGRDRGCRVTCRDFGTRAQCSDADGDGWLAYVEARYGSDPNDVASFPGNGSCIDFGGSSCSP